MLSERIIRDTEPAPKKETSPFIGIQGEGRAGGCEGDVPPELSSEKD